MQRTKRAARGEETPFVAEPRRPRPWAAFAYALASTLVVGVAAVRAEDQLDVPASCGTPSELEREVAALRPASAVGPRPRVALRSAGELFLLEVALPDGVRRLRDRDCRSLFHAAVVIAALGPEAPLEPSRDEPQAAAVQEPRAQAAALTPAPPPAARAGRDPPRAPDEATNRARRPRAERAEQAERATVEVPPQRSAEERDSGSAERQETGRAPRAWPPLAARVELGIGAAAGIVPSVGIASSAGVLLGGGRFSARLLATYLAPRTEERELGRGVRIDAVGPSLTLEWRLLAALRAGLGGDLLLLRGRGVGLARSRTDWATLGALHVGAAVRLVAGRRWGLELPVRVLYAPQPCRFVARGVGALYESSPFAFFAALAATWRFL